MKVGTQQHFSSQLINQDDIILVYFFLQIIYVECYDNSIGVLSEVEFISIFLWKTSQVSTLCALVAKGLI